MAHQKLTVSVLKVFKGSCMTYLFLFDNPVLIQDICKHSLETTHLQPHFLHSSLNLFMGDSLHKFSSSKALCIKCGNSFFSNLCWPKPSDFLRQGKRCFQHKKKKSKSVTVRALQNKRLKNTRRKPVLLRSVLKQAIPQLQASLPPPFKSRSETIASMSKASASQGPRSTKLEAKRVLQELHMPHQKYCKTGNSTHKINVSVANISNKFEVH